MVNLETKVNEFKISNTYYKNATVLGYYYQAEKFITYYLELLKGYQKIMQSILLQLTETGETSS